VAAEQVAHESAYLGLGPERRKQIMAPLQAQNQQLQSENHELRARVAALEPLQAQNEQLQSENQDLRERVAALEALQAREAALQPREAALRPQAAALQSVRRLKQRRQIDTQQAAGAHATSASVPQTDDAPPSGAAVRRMGIVAVVGALQAHVAVARVVEEACRRMADLAEEGDRQSALEAGALEAVQAAMEAHPKEAGVLEGAGAALRARWADGERLVAGGKGLWG
jgi:regulator of replication initiation timing